MQRSPALALWVQTSLASLASLVTDKGPTIQFQVCHFFFSLTTFSQGFPFPVYLKVSVNSSEAAHKLNMPSCQHSSFLMLWILMAGLELSSQNRGRNAGTVPPLGRGTVQEGEEVGEQSSGEMVSRRIQTATRSTEGQPPLILVIRESLS